MGVPMDTLMVTAKSHTHKELPMLWKDFSEAASASRLAAARRFAVAGASGENNSGDLWTAKEALIE